MIKGIVDPNILKFGTLTPIKKRNTISRPKQASPARLRKREGDFLKNTEQ
jgi:hypothetical protein